jgi:acyl-CoA dehydrogenase
LTLDMDFAMSATAADYLKRLTAFMVEFVFPAESAYHRHRQQAGPGITPCCDRVGAQGAGQG